MKEKKNNITELVFIIDRSGSMFKLVNDTIGGFNSMIEKQKKQDGECYVSTVLFNDSTKVLHDRVRLENVSEMTGSDYTVGGCTALIDAIGGAIHHIGNIHKYAREEDIPAHTMFVIMTDGYENASHLYSADSVRRTIKRQKSKYGWEFIFIGANIDAVETAGRFGIDSDRAVNYNADSQGTAIVYEAVSKAVKHIRESTPLPSGWSCFCPVRCPSRGRYGICCRRRASGGASRSPCCASLPALPPERRSARRLPHSRRQAGCATRSSPRPSG